MTEYDLWPRFLNGKGIIACGEDSIINVIIKIDGNALDEAKINVSMIQEKWSILWPSVLAVGQPVFDYESRSHDYIFCDIGYPSDTVYMFIPTEIITNQTEWCLSIYSGKLKRYCSYIYIIGFDPLTVKLKGGIKRNCPYEGTFNDQCRFIQ